MAIQSERSWRSQHTSGYHVPAAHCEKRNRPYAPSHTGETLVGRAGARGSGQPVAPFRRRALALLAERLAPYHPAATYASVEPKAAQTAQLVAERLGIPWATRPGLREHNQSNVGFLSDVAFQEAVAQCLARPDALGFGGETAAAARARFTRVRVSEATARRQVAREDVGMRCRSSRPTTALRTTASTWGRARRGQGGQQTRPELVGLHALSLPTAVNL